METMFYKRTDYTNHENDSAVAVPSRFESYIASHLFVTEKKKKKKKYLNDVSLEKMSWNINVLCWVLTQKHKQTWVFGERNKGQTDSLLPVYTYLKMPCKCKSSIKNTPCLLMFGFAGFIQKLNFLLCKTAMHQLSPSYSLI